ncbi:hypothetical protein COO59_09660 [Mixta theicola]|uniref:Uncharacterized protein n=1 Tax=Mixta theicola TaxID=1458355 RepID=A0A2K1Q9U4_9GAMM|nr:hypothetical protein COO59_09660 [Mixta theicola]
MIFRYNRCFHIGYSISVDELTIYPSYFTLHVRWLSSLTAVTYWCKRLGIHCVGLQRKLFRV